MAKINKYCGLITLFSSSSISYNGYIVFSPIFEVKEEIISGLCLISFIFIFAVVIFNKADKLLGLTIFVILLILFILVILFMSLLLNILGLVFISFLRDKKRLNLRNKFSKDKSGC